MPTGKRVFHGTIQIDIDVQHADQLDTLRGQLQKILDLESLEQSIKDLGVQLDSSLGKISASLSRKKLVLPQIVIPKTFIDSTKIGKELAKGLQPTLQDLGRQIPNVIAAGIRQAETTDLATTTDDLISKLMSRFESRLGAKAPAAGKGLTESLRKIVRASLANVGEEAPTAAEEITARFTAAIENSAAVIAARAAIANLPTGETLSQEDVALRNKAMQTLRDAAIISAKIVADVQSALAQVKATSTDYKSLTQDLNEVAAATTKTTEATELYTLHLANKKAVEQYLNNLRQIALASAETGKPIAELLRPIQAALGDVDSITKNTLKSITAAFGMFRADVLEDPSVPEALKKDWEDLNLALIGNSIIPNMFQGILAAQAQFNATMLKLQPTTALLDSWQKLYDNLVGNSIITEGNRSIVQSWLDLATSIASIVEGKLHPIVERDLTMEIDMANVVLATDSLTEFTWSMAKLLRMLETLAAIQPLAAPSVLNDALRALVTSSDEAIAALKGLAQHTRGFRHSVGLAQQDLLAMVDTTKIIANPIAHFTTVIAGWTNKWKVLAEQHAVLDVIALRITALVADYDALDESATRVWRAVGPVQEEFFTGPQYVGAGLAEILKYNVQIEKQLYTFVANTEKLQEIVGELATTGTGAIQRFAQALAQADVTWAHMAEIGYETVTSYSKLEQLGGIIEPLTEVSALLTRVGGEAEELYKKMLPLLELGGATAGMSMKRWGILGKLTESAPFRGNIASDMLGVLDEARLGEAEKALTTFFAGVLDIQNKLLTAYVQQIPEELQGAFRNVVIAVVDNVVKLTALQFPAMVVSVAEMVGKSSHELLALVEFNNDLRPFDAIVENARAAKKLLVDNSIIPDLVDKSITLIRDWSAQITKFTNEVIQNIQYAQASLQQPSATPQFFKDIQAEQLDRALVKMQELQVPDTMPLVASFTTLFQSLYQLEARLSTVEQALQLTSHALLGFVNHFAGVTDAGRQIDQFIPRLYVMKETLVEIGQKAAVFEKIQQALQGFAKGQSPLPLVHKGLAGVNDDLDYFAQLARIYGKDITLLEDEIERAVSLFSKLAVALQRLQELQQGGLGTQLPANDAPNAYAFSALGYTLDEIRLLPRALAELSQELNNALDFSKFSTEAQLFADIIWDIGNAYAELEDILGRLSDSKNYGRLFGGAAIPELSALTSFSDLSPNVSFDDFKKDVERLLLELKQNISKNDPFYPIVLFAQKTYDTIVNNSIIPEGNKAIVDSTKQMFASLFKESKEGFGVLPKHAEANYSKVKAVLKDLEKVTSEAEVDIGRLGWAKSVKVGIESLESAQAAIPKIENLVATLKELGGTDVSKAAQTLEALRAALANIANIDFQPVAFAKEGGFDASVFKNVITGWSNVLETIGKIPVAGYFANQMRTVLDDLAGGFLSAIQEGNMKPLLITSGKLIAGVVIGGIAEQFVSGLGLADVLAQYVGNIDLATITSLGAFMGGELATTIAGSLAVQLRDMSANLAKLPIFTPIIANAEQVYARLFGHSIFPDILSKIREFTKKIGQQKFELFGSFVPTDAPQDVDAAIASVLTTVQDAPMQARHLMDRLANSIKRDVIPAILEMADAFNRANTSGEAYVRIWRGIIEGYRDIAEGPKYVAEALSTAVGYAHELNSVFTAVVEKQAAFNDLLRIQKKHYDDIRGSGKHGVGVRAGELATGGSLFGSHLGQKSAKMVKQQESIIDVSYLQNLGKVESSWQKIDDYILQSTGDTRKLLNEYIQLLEVTKLLGQFSKAIDFEEYTWGINDAGGTVRTVLKEASLDTSLIDFTATFKELQKFKIDIESFLNDVLYPIIKKSPLFEPLRQDAEKTYDELFGKSIIPDMVNGIIGEVNRLETELGEKNVFAQLMGDAGSALTTVLASLDTTIAELLSNLGSLKGEVKEVAEVPPAPKATKELFDTMFSVVNLKKAAVALVPTFIASFTPLGPVGAVLGKAIIETFTIYVFKHKDAIINAANVIFGKIKSGISGFMGTISQKVASVNPFKSLVTQAEETHDELFEHSVFPDIVKSLQRTLSEMRANVKDANLFKGVGQAVKSLQRTLSEMRANVKDANLFKGVGQAASQITNQFDDLEGRINGLARSYELAYNVFAKGVKTDKLRSIGITGPRGNQIKDRRQAYKALQQEATSKERLIILEKELADAIAAKNVGDIQLAQRRLEIYHELIDAVTTISKSQQQARVLQSEAVNIYKDLDDVARQTTKKGLKPLEDTVIGINSALVQVGRTPGEFFQAWREGFVGLSVSGKYTIKELRDGFLAMDKAIVSGAITTTDDRSKRYKKLTKDLRAFIGNSTKLLKAGVAGIDDTVILQQSLAMLQMLRDDVLKTEQDYQKSYDASIAAATAGDTKLANLEQAKAARLRKSLADGRQEIETNERQVERLRVDVGIRQKKRADATKAADNDALKNRKAKFAAMAELQAAERARTTRSYIATTNIIKDGTKVLHDALFALADKLPLQALKMMFERIPKMVRKAQASFEDFNVALKRITSETRLSISKGIVPDPKNVGKQLRPYLESARKHYISLITKLSERRAKTTDPAGLVELDKMIAVLGTELQTLEERYSHTMKQIADDTREAADKIAENSAKVAEQMATIKASLSGVSGAGTGVAGVVEKRFFGKWQTKRAAKAERQEMGRIVALREINGLWDKALRKVNQMQVESHGLGEATSKWARVLGRTEKFLKKHVKETFNLTKHQKLVLQMARRYDTEMDNITQAAKGYREVMKTIGSGFSGTVYSDMVSYLGKLKTSQSEIRKSIEKDADISSTQLQNFEENLEKSITMLNKLKKEAATPEDRTLIEQLESQIEPLKKTVEYYKSLEKGQKAAGAEAQQLEKANTGLFGVFKKIRAGVGLLTNKFAFLRKKEKSAEKGEKDFANTTKKTVAVVATAGKKLGGLGRVFGKVASGLKASIAQIGVGMLRNIGFKITNALGNITRSFGEVNNRVQQYGLSLEGFFEAINMETQRKKVAESMGKAVSDFEIATLRVDEIQEKFTKLGKDRMNTWLNDMLKTTGFQAEQIQDLGKKILSLGLAGGPEEWGRVISDMVEKAGGGQEKLDQIMTHIGKMQGNLTEGFYGLTEALALDRTEIKVWYAENVKGQKEALKFFDKRSGKARTSLELIKDLGMSQEEANARLKEAGLAVLDYATPIKNLTEEQLRSLGATMKGGIKTAENIEGIVDSAGKLIVPAKDALVLMQEYGQQSGKIAGQSAKQAQSLSTAWGNIKDTFNEWMQLLGADVWARGAAMINNLMDALGDDTDGSSALATVAQNMKDLGIWAADVMEWLLDPVRWQLAWKLISGIGEALNAIIHLDVTKLAQAVARIGEAVGMMLGKTTDEAKKWGGGLIDYMKLGLERRAQQLWNAFTNILTRLRNMLPFSPVKEGPLKGLENTGSKLVSTITSGIFGQQRQISKAAGMIGDTIYTGVGQIGANLQRYKGAAFGFGTSFMNTFAGGLVAAGKSSVVGAMSYVGSLLSQLQGRSPPSIAPTIDKDGANVARLFARGIIAGSSDINKAIGGIATRFSGLRNESLQWGRGITRSFTGGIVDEGQKAIAPAMEQIGGMVNSYLAGHSPPKLGPLSTIDKSGANVAKTFSETMGMAFAKTKKDAENMLSPMKEAFDGVVDKAAETKDKLVVHSEIPDMMGMMKQIIQQGGTDVVDTFDRTLVKPMIASANYLRDVLVGNTIFEDIGEGIAAHVEAGAKKTVTSIENMSTEVQAVLSQFAGGMFTGFSMETFAVFDSAIGLVRSKLELLTAGIDNGAAQVTVAMAKVRSVIAQGLQNLAAGMGVSEVMGGIRGQLAGIVGTSANLMSVIQAEFESSVAQQAAAAIQKEVEAAKKARQAQLEAAQAGLQALQDRISAAKERRQAAMEIVKDQVEAIREANAAEHEANKERLDALQSIIDSYKEQADEAKKAIEAIDAQIEDEVDARLQAMGVVIDESRIAMLQAEVKKAQRNVDEAQKTLDGLVKARERYGITVMSAEEVNAQAALDLAMGMKDAAEEELSAEEAKKEQRERMIAELRETYKAEYASYQARIEAAEEAAAQQEEIKAQVQAAEDALTKQEEAAIKPLEKRLEAMQKQDEAASKAEEKRLKAAQQHVNAIQKATEQANKADDARLKAAQANAADVGANAQLLRKAYEEEQAALKDRAEAAKEAAKEAAQEAVIAGDVWADYTPPSPGEISDSLVRKAQRFLEGQSAGLSLGITNGIKTFLQLSAEKINTRFGEIFDIENLFETVEVYPGRFEKKLKPVSKIIESLFTDVGDKIAGFLGFEDFKEVLQKIRGPLMLIGAIIAGPTLVGALGVLAGIISTVIGVIAAPAGFIATIVGIAAALNPVTVIIGILAALLGGLITGAIYAFTKHGDKMREIGERIGQALGRIKAAITGTEPKAVKFGGIVKTLTGFMGKLVGAIMTAVDWVGEKFAGVFIWLAENAAGAIEKLAGFIEGAVALGRALKDVFTGKGTAKLKEFFSDFGTKIKDFFLGLLSWGPKLLKKFIGIVIKYFKKLFNKLIGRSILTDLFSGIEDLFKGLTKKAPKLLSKLFKKLVKGVLAFGKLYLKTYKKIFGFIWSKAIKPVITYVRNNIGKWLGSLGKLLQKYGPKVLAGAKKLFGVLKTVIEKVWPHVIAGLKTGLSKALELIKKYGPPLLSQGLKLFGKLVSAAATKIKELADKFPEWWKKKIKPKLEEWLPKLGAVARRIFAQLKKTASDAIQKLADKFPVWWEEKIKPKLLEWKEKLFAKAKEIFTRLKDGAREKIDELRDKIPVWWEEKIKPKLLEWKEKLFAKAKEIWEKLPKAASEAAQKLADKIPVWWEEKIKPKLLEWKEKLFAKAKEIWEKLPKAAREKMSDLANAISDKWNDIAEKLSEWGPKILEKAKDVWGNFKTGAFEKLDEFKTDLDWKLTVIVNKIAANEHVQALISKAKELWDNFGTAAKDTLDTFKDTELGGLISGIATKFSDGTYVDEFKTAAGTLFQGFADAFKLAAEGNWGGALDAIKTAVHNAIGDISLFDDAGNVFTTFVDGAKQILVGDGTWGNPAEGSFIYRLQHMFDNLSTSLGAAVGGTFDTILDGIKSTVNSVINQINTVLNMLETIIGAFEIPAVVFDIPAVPIVLPSGATINVFGGWDPDITITDIPLPFPTLAAGGLVVREMYARIAEAGPEAVIPLDRLWDIIGRALDTVSPEAMYRQLAMQTVTTSNVYQVTFNNTFNDDVSAQRVRAVTRAQLNEFDAWQHQIRR